METTATVKTLEDFQRLQKHCRQRRDAVTHRVLVCGGTGCRAAGSVPVYQALQQAVADLGLTGVEVKLTGCHGLCERGPVVVIGDEQVFYGRFKPEDAAEVLRSTIVEGKPIKKLLYRDPGSRKTIAKAGDIPFYAHQQRVALRCNGLIDPTDIQDFIALGGYEALARALHAMTPEQVLSEVEASGLRGRGGGGFPTGRKWRSAAEQPEPSAMSSATATKATRGPSWTSGAGGQPPRHPRGDAPGRLSRSARIRATSTCATSIPWPGEQLETRSRRPVTTACSATTSWAAASASTSRSCAAAGRSSAASPRRC